ncbi:MAG: dTDP-4-dehydrorhamnose reductase, partial [Parabacteroides sp.]|nr:dTDP-4-dehydrorhamnose reductase [Parabacteroides sp.]
VGNLGEAAVKQGAKVIHVSTDYVFDGTSCKPYKENDQTCPVSVYGRTKLAGEEALFAACPASVVLRTAWLYSPFGNNFVKTMLRLGKEKDQLTVVFDQVGSPTYAADLAEAMLSVVLQAENGHFEAGIYHYSNEGVCSWYDFTVKIHQLAGITTCKVLPVGSESYPTKASRPHYSVLNKGKIKEVYKLEIPHWETSLRLCIERLTAQI